jgi:predicted phosphoribosyltransferase
MTTTDAAKVKVKPRISPWRGDPVDRRAQEVIAAEFGRAYYAHENAKRLNAQIQALVAERNGYNQQRDASFGVIAELRFNITEAAKLLPLVDVEFAGVDTEELVKVAQQSAARACYDCRRGEGRYVPCALHEIRTEES